ncbi:MAG TPA: response regulator transcription factor [Syntrophomonas sp.]|nr:response regulator transcription factor [Syntrophomonas sp.]
MNKTILLVEDDHLMRQLVADYFETEGYAVLEADNGERAIEIIKSRTLDLIILDIMLPRMDGWTVCRAARHVSNVPIIIVTARGHEEDRLLGFELGADDYVTKPFSPRELVARAKALIKRSGDAGHAPSETLCQGVVQVDRISHEVRVAGELIYMSPKEYDLLLYLMNNSGMVLSREQLLLGVWGYSHYGNLRTVDTHINRLREKMGRCADVIQTVRGFGYKFNPSGEPQKNG